jgi:hypothetical protein
VICEPHNQREGSGSGKHHGAAAGASSTADQEAGPRTPDPKTLRRLAQNREAARKSRLRKKVIIIVTVLLQFTYTDDNEGDDFYPYYYLRS